MPALHSVLLIQYNAFHRVFTTVVGTIKCTIGPLHTLHLCIGWHVYSLIIIIIEGGAYGVFKTSACLILWPMRWAPFLGRLLRCYKWKNDFFSSLFWRWSQYCKAHQSNALLQYMYVLAGHGGYLYLHWLVYDLQYPQPGSTTVPVLKQ